GHDHDQGRHGNLLQRLGCRPTHRVPPWLAAQRRRLGQPDAVLPRARLQGHRARPAWARTLDTDRDRQRYGHLCRRRGDADRGARPQGRDPHRPLDGGWRGCALCRPRRQGPCRQGGADRRGPADHGEVRQEPRRPADRGVRRLPRAGRFQPGAVLQGRAHPVLWLQPRGRDRVRGNQGELVAPGHDGRDQGAVRLHRGLLGNRLHRRPEDDRRSRARHARRRRPDRAVRGLRAPVGRVAPEGHAQGLQGPTARHVRHTPGNHQPGPACVRSWM
ncbi:MAG: Non-heme chloroperoxidase, partial [uncultured Acetobacteraceae bacterium]